MGSELSTDMIKKKQITLTQEYDSTLSFGTDTWTSPNSKAYVAVTVHLECEGVPLCMLLDIVEVAKSHSDVNLAEAFMKILEEFNISEKVGVITIT